MERHRQATSRPSLGETRNGPTLGRVVDRTIRSRMRDLVVVQEIAPRSEQVRTRIMPVSDLQRKAGEVRDDLRDQDKEVHVTQTTRWMPPQLAAGFLTQPD